MGQLPPALSRTLGIVISMTGKVDNVKVSYLFFDEIRGDVAGTQGNIDQIVVPVDVITYPGPFGIGPF